MPHSSFRVLPGIDTTKTPTLNEAAISSCQLVRFMPDRTMGAIVQKLGGWIKYISNNIGSTVRSLWAWEDTNSKAWLGVGSDGIVSVGKSLQVVNNGSLTDISPQQRIDNVAVGMTTVVGSNKIQITDAGSNIGNYDAVFIQTHMTFGGVVLFGLYQCEAGSANTYFIYATDAGGFPWNATAAVGPGGVNASFTTAVGSAYITVALANHRYNPGDTFAVLIPVAVGGVTLSGNYDIVSVVPSVSFVISAQNTATSVATVFENAGNAHYVYWLGLGPLPTGLGYGLGPYGLGGYGTGVAPAYSTGTPITTTDWTLDNYGELLIACPLNGPVFYWSPQVNSSAAIPIGGGPPVNHGAFVAMPQRQIVAWGSTFSGIHDPLLIRWCDTNDFTAWTAQITNQAGSYRIPKGSVIVQCLQGPQQGLVFTDVGVWAMQYVGQPYVYQFNELGFGCGLVGRHAAGVMAGVVYWMGQSQFYRLSGAGVEPIKCAVWDIIFQNIDMTQADRVEFAANSRFGEVAWHYPVRGSGGQQRAFVKYNVNLDVWDYGVNTTNSDSQVKGVPANPFVARTAWINESVLGPPIGAGLGYASDGSTGYYLYQHETSPNADGTPLVSSFQTGYFALSEADVKTFIDQIWVDMRWGYYNDPWFPTSNPQDANVYITFYGTDYPNQTPVKYGPFLMTRDVNYITPRIRARLLSIKLESYDISSFWRLGLCRYRFAQDGKY